MAINNEVLRKRSLVQGLLTECPLDKPLEDCPAKEVRGLPYEERSVIVASMSETELDLIISHHRYCFQKRRLDMSFMKIDTQQQHQLQL